jgi:hypothetical protein
VQPGGLEAVTKEISLVEKSEIVGEAMSDAKAFILIGCHR